MKKILSVLVFQLMSVAAIMAAQVDYKVTGELPASFNGSKVYINRFEGRFIAPVDSTVVSDGKFVMSGKLDKTYIGEILSTSTDGEKHFVIEDTPAIVSFADDKLQVSGGRRNQALDYFNKNINLDVFIRRIPNIDALISEAQDSATTKERKEEIARKVFDDARPKYIKAVKNFVMENSDNMVGAYVFTGEYNNYEPEEVDALMAQAGDEFKNDNTVKRIVEIVEKSKVRKVGAKYIDFAQPDKDGNIHKLSEYLANCKYLLVDFWASWCGPCRAEMPNVKAAYEKYHAKGFDILGVSLDNDRNKWINAIETLGLKWHHLSDLKGWDCEASNSYGVQSIPCTLLIANDGTIVAANLRGDALENKLAELLK